MHVVFLNPLGILGGAERVLLDLFAPLQRAVPGIRLSLIAGSDGPLVDRARALGVGAEVLPLPPSVAALGSEEFAQLARVRPAALVRSGKRAAVALRDAIGYAGRLTTSVRRLRPDIVHSNGIKTHLMTVVTAPLGVPVLWHVHDFLGDRGALARVLGLASRRVTVAVANSNAVAADARRVLGCRVELVYNGVEPGVFTPQGPRADLDALAGVPSAEGALRIGLVATYARWKGHQLFLDAAAALRARLPGRAMRFYIVGGPVYLSAGSQYSAAELRDRADALGLAGVVALVPFQEEPAAVFRSLDVVVHASTQREPFGRTIVEAMACGRAVAVADAGGAAELFRDGVDALGYEAGSVRALTDVLARLATDPDLRERLGHAARATAVRRFDGERLGGEFAAIYRSVRQGEV